jgi:phytanoyl-CoA hydroxylase
MSYFESGYVVVNCGDVAADIQRINGLLATILSLDAGDPNFFDLVNGKFTELFQDKEEYLGFLKAFTNSPIVQAISSRTELLEHVKKCGVENPTLVTPPILHVVGNGLIINEAKVFTPAHQDVVSTKGSVGQVVVWIPLHNVDEDNFGICAIPGSHKLGLLETDPSEFGHTVKPVLIDGMKSEYLSLKQGESVIFSQYLVHQTHKIGKFRMALSFRFNDISDEAWRKRKYFVPFERIPVGKEFEDLREQPPKIVKEYFDR